MAKQINEILNNMPRNTDWEIIKYLKHELSFTLAVIDRADPAFSKFEEKIRLEIEHARNLANDTGRQSEFVEMRKREAFFEQIRQMLEDFKKGE